MKIGFDAKRAFHNNRGLGNYSRDLIRILQEKNDAQLVLFNPKHKEDNRVKINEKTSVISPKSFLWKKLKGLWRTLKISKLAQKEKLDIYHGLSGEIPLGIFKKTKTIVTIHDLIFIRFPNLYSFFDRNIHFLKFRYAARHSHQIIAISEQTKNDIVHFLKIPPEKISVVYQGCHRAFKTQYTDNEKLTIHKKYDLPEKFVLYVGAIEPRKNALEIVKAIKNLDISLVMVGKKTPYFKQIEQFCTENNLHHRVKILKNIPMEELAIVYQLAEIFCYPSVFEGFGIPIIEALFSKVPVITSGGSCFAEAGGEHSVYINLENASKEIENAISEILANPEKRKQMVEKGFEHAQKFTDEAVYEQLIKIYSKFV